MTDKLQNLKDLVAEIEAAEPDAKIGFQKALSALVDEIEEAGGEVAPEVLSLRDELVNEVIEAQFDNMPV